MCVSPRTFENSLASFFEEEDRLPEPKLALEQAQARVELSGCLLILAS
jgi:hypothetical protein